MRDGMPNTKDSANNMNKAKATNANTQSFTSSLSFASRQFDGGNKGYLTPAEKKVREMDEDGDGELSNVQIVHMMEHTMALKHANKSLRWWVIGLMVAVIVLGIGNMCVAITAAILAKETDVDSNTGELRVRGGDTAVVTVSEGKIHTTTITENDESGNRIVCMNTYEVANLWRSSSHGTATNLMISSGGPAESNDNGATATDPRELQMYKFEASSANETHVCFDAERSSEKKLVCVDFTSPCTAANGGGGGRRPLRGLANQEEAEQEQPFDYQPHIDLFFALVSKHGNKAQEDNVRRLNGGVGAVGTGGGVGGGCSGPGCSTGFPANIGK